MFLCPSVWNWKGDGKEKEKEGCSILGPHHRHHFTFDQQRLDNNEKPTVCKEDVTVNSDSIKKIIVLSRFFLEKVLETQHHISWSWKSKRYYNQINTYYTLINKSFYCQIWFSTVIPRYWQVMEVIVGARGTKYNIYK